MQAMFLNSERNARFAAGVTAAAERLLILTLPLALAAAAIMVSMRPGYVQRAYRALPPDPHGFSAAERLDLALVTLAFLTHPAPPQTAVSLPARMTLPNEETPLYDARELAHLVDVKRLTDAIRAWGGGLGLLSAACLAWLLYRRETRPRGWRAAQRGAGLTLRLLAAAVLPALLFWPAFFVTFHELLFPPGSWTFAGDATLIRLFPEAFWSGYAISLLGSLLAATGALFLLGGALARRALVGAETRQAAALPAVFLPTPDADRTDETFWEISPRRKGGRQ